MKLTMFQTFDNTQASADHSERVAKLRELMVKGGLDAVLVPRSPTSTRGSMFPAAPSG